MAVVKLTIVSYQRYSKIGLFEVFIKYLENYKVIRKMVLITLLAKFIGQLVSLKMKIWSLLQNITFWHNTVGRIKCF